MAALELKTNTTIHSL